jgi:hypothetical protein
MTKADLIEELSKVSNLTKKESGTIVCLAEVLSKEQGG